MSHGRPRVALLERVAAVPVGLVLALLVGLSTAVRTVAAVGPATQVYFPDEYIYTALACGFAETGRPVIRGHAAHFPSILEPLLASPFRLFHDPLLAYPVARGWLDQARLGHVSLLETPGNPAGRTFEQRSWNGSVDGVYLFGGVPAFDDFGSKALQIDHDGRLVTPAGRVDGALLVENYAVRLHLRDAALVRPAMGFELWRPLGPRARTGSCSVAPTTAGLPAGDRSSSGLTRPAARRAPSASS